MKLSHTNRMGALTYKYLAQYEEGFATKWALQEYSADSFVKMTKWIDSHPEDIASHERSAAICRANYAYCAYRFATTSDAKLIREINTVSDRLAKAEEALQHWLTVSNEEGGMQVFIGDSNN